MGVYKATMSRDEAKAKESLTALFGKIDKNANGSLDMAELKRVFGDMAEQFLKFCDQDSDKAITCDEWLAGIINDTGDLSEEDFQATWVTRMATCVADAEAAEAAAAPKMAASGKATWEQVTCAESPKERSSHGLTYNPDDGSVYCWGGEHVARTAIDSVAWRFKDGAWTALEATGAVPEPRIAHGQAIVGGALYVWGGRQGVTVGDGNLDDFHKLDLTTLEWSPITAEGGPCPRSFQQMCSTPGKIHVFGGCPDEGRLSDLHTFDIESSTWTKQPDQGMRGRGGAGFESNTSGTALFVIAGFAGEETQDVYKFDLASSTWSTVPSDTLRPRSVFPLCTVGNKIVIFGGEVDPSAAGHSGAGDFANDTLMLDTETLEWSAVETAVCPPERGWTRMTATGENTFVLFGGLAGNDENPLRMNDTWVGTLEL